MKVYEELLNRYDNYDHYNEIFSPSINKLKKEKERDKKLQQ